LGIYVTLFNLLGPSDWWSRNKHCSLVENRSRTQSLICSRFYMWLKMAGSESVGGHNVVLAQIQHFNSTPRWLDNVNPWKWSLSFKNAKKVWFWMVSHFLLNSVVGIRSWSYKSRHYWKARLKSIQLVRATLKWQSFNFCSRTTTVCNLNHKKFSTFFYQNFLHVGASSPRAQDQAFEVQHPVFFSYYLVLPVRLGCTKKGTRTQDMQDN